MHRAQDVAVVGAGAFGAWTALCLAERGARVTLIDMHGVGNPLASSGGESRNFRAAYGANRFYSEWAIAAWALWLEREAEFGVRLVYPSGSLRAGSESELSAQARCFTALGAPFELLDGDEMAARWPQVRPGEARAFYEPRSGVLAAKRTLQEVERALLRRGTSILRARATLEGRPPKLELIVDGEPLPCGAIVIACGPWLPSLLPRLLGPLIRTPRRELLFVAPPTGDARFGWENCPNLVDPLGWTSADIGNGVKIAPPMKGIDMDPTGGDRHASDIAIAGTARFLAARLPDLARRPIVSTYVSQLENTASEDFIIDRHPEAPRVVIAGGGSGHAFKFGPLIGDYVARLTLDGGCGEHVDRFGLAAHRPLRLGEAG